MIDILHVRLRFMIAHMQALHVHWGTTRKETRTHAQMHARCFTTAQVMALQGDISHMGTKTSYVAG